eukprot:PITA_31267
MRGMTLITFLFLASFTRTGKSETGIGIPEAEEPVSSNYSIPAIPVDQQEKKTCHLDLSDELFGGVKENCVNGRKGLLDRSRCCPVLAAWLYAAYARTALQTAPSPVSSSSSSSELQPFLPDDEQICADSLQSSLKTRGINIPKPNATCDPILCFCDIRLHHITSLTCSNAFNLSNNHSAAAPLSAVRALENNCRNSSYQGCTNCLKALQKLKGRPGNNGDHSDRASKMYNRDCKLMGLTWLLAKNKTAYIPTVSAVLRALMYSTYTPNQPTCSPDRENMPLALDSLELDHVSSAATRAFRIHIGGVIKVFSTIAVLLLLQSL